LKGEITLITAKCNNFCYGLPVKHKKSKKSDQN
jgi:hypothetical protein